LNNVEIVLADLTPIALPDFAILGDEKAHANASAEDLRIIALIDCVSVV
jgi:hypothetical protein